ncbi:MAG: hypothetical protein MZV64_33590 [Ignavibacteriales bacterium]|nr:hypothetical protein [Ignavibacteriales bacterium]
MPRGARPDRPRRRRRQVRPSSTAPTSWPRSSASGSASKATSSPTPRSPRPRLDLDDTGRPLFAVRGIQPFHDFPEGPDWWTLENYKAVLSQLPKLPHELLRPPHLPRESQQGARSHPQRRADGLDRPRPGTSGPDGTVAASYPASYQNTARGNWGYEVEEDRRFPLRREPALRARRFRQRRHGRSQPRPGHARGLERGLRPGRGRLPRRLQPGPAPRRQDLRRDGDGPDRARPGQGAPDRLRPRPEGPGRRQGPLPKAMFERIAAGLSRRLLLVLDDRRAGPGTTPRPKPIKAVTDGPGHGRPGLERGGPALPAWPPAAGSLGPPSSRTLFDQVLPKDVALSTINREVGKAPVGPGLRRASAAGRSGPSPGWRTIPALTSPQLWAGRMRRDAADALRYGCDGPARHPLADARPLGQRPLPWPGRPGTRAGTPCPERVADDIGPVTGQYLELRGTSRSPGAERRAAVYRDVRDRVFAYHLKVPNGTYAVTLQLVEGADRPAPRPRLRRPHPGPPKVRRERRHLRPRSGATRPSIRRSRTSRSPTGSLVIDFADRIHYPAVAGLVVAGPGFVQEDQLRRPGRPRLRGGLAGDGTPPRCPRPLPRTGPGPSSGPRRRPRSRPSSPASTAAIRSP